MAPASALLYSLLVVFLPASPSGNLGTESFRSSVQQSKYCFADDPLLRKVHEPLLLNVIRISSQAVRTILSLFSR